MTYLPLPETSIDPRNLRPSLHPQFLGETLSLTSPLTLDSWGENPDGYSPWVSWSSKGNSEQKGVTKVPVL